MLFYILEPSGTLKRKREKMGTIAGVNGSKIIPESFGRLSNYGACMNKGELWHCIHTNARKHTSTQDIKWQNLTYHKVHQSFFPGSTIHMRIQRQAYEYIADFKCAVRKTKYYSIYSILEKSIKKNYLYT